MSNLLPEFDSSRLDTDWDDLNELFADIRKYVKEHPGVEVMSADDPGVGYTPPRIPRLGWSAFQIQPTEHACENVRRLARGEPAIEWDEQARYWTIPVASNGLALSLKTASGRQALAKALSTR
jgi:hypothetical protein